MENTFSQFKIHFLKYFVLLNTEICNLCLSDLKIVDYRIQYWEKNYVDKCCHGGKYVKISMLSYFITI